MTLDNIAAQLDPTNLNEDPLFGANYHLQSNSLPIDMGIATEAPPRDMDGDVRPKMGTAVDIGADEAL